MGDPQINHHREGAGEPLVLLHGVGHHWQAWQPVIDLVGGEFEIVACDTPGLGASPALPLGVTPTIPHCADAFQAFFARAGLDRPHVAGNSMGGALALELARRGAARSATAFSPAGFWSPLERRWCQAVLGVLAGVPPAARPATIAAMRRPAVRDALTRVLYAWPRKLTGDEMEAGLRAAWGAPAFAAAVRAFDEYDFEGGDDLRGVPVTVAWGRHDLLLPYRTQARRARERLPHARHLTLGAGHLPYTDDPAAVAATLRLGAGRPA